jgi:membrane protein DedA with SNARE-associated domain
MNPWVLWIPGSLLIVLGAIFLGLRTVEVPAATVLIVIGAVLESSGVLLWIRERNRKGGS